MAFMLDRIRGRFVPGERNILVGHAWVTGGDPSDSERPLSVGGTGEVPSSLFAGFDYVALGHLHRPQSLDGGRIRYAGSLLPYSLSEVNHAKSVTVAELSGAAPVATERSLPSLRGFRRVEGPLADLLRSEPSDDYCWVTYTDAAPQHAPAERLRRIWPNLLQAVRATGGAAASTIEPGISATEVRAKELSELFREFAGQTLPEPLTGEQAAALDSLVAEFRRQGREE
jgi:exonuclease SbcD